MSNLPSLREANITGKTILLRADLNVPIVNGKLQDTTRIKELLPTLTYLMHYNCKIIIISHFGRPNGSFNQDMSLAVLINELAHLLKKNIKFSSSCIGEDTKKIIDNLEDGGVVLLENLRFYPGEESNDHNFAKQLSSLADIYVNDTFSCSHRAHASIHAITNYLPSYAGFLLEKEISSLESIFNNAKKPITAIIGGSKVSTKLKLLYSLINRSNLIIIGGAMANTFLKAQGLNIGNSIYEQDLIEDSKQIIKHALVSNCEILLPIDVITASDLKSAANIMIEEVNNIQDNIIFDIGPKTVEIINSKLEDSSTLIWNGPLGAYEYKPFDIGTACIGRKVASLTNKNSLTSVIGGGDVVSALTECNLINNFSYISTGGGAFLEWFEGVELPGIKALKTQVLD